MTVLASYNIKGGVGKTATAVNLAHLAAQGGYRTLLWDLDPQGAATFYFRVKPKVKGGVRRLLGKRHDPSKAIRGTDYEGLDVLPADFTARHFDVHLDRTRRPMRRFKRLVRRLRKEYDRIYVDCAPGIGFTSECVFRVADALIVPTIPTTLSLQTLKQLQKYFRHRKGRPPRVLPFLSMVDRRKQLHREICERAHELPFECLSTTIPYSSEVERMGTRRMPLAAYAASSDQAEAYRALAREIDERLRRRPSSRAS